MSCPKPLTCYRWVRMSVFQQLFIEINLFEFQRFARAPVTTAFIGLSRLHNILMTTLDTIATPVEELEKPLSSTFQLPPLGLLQSNDDHDFEVISIVSRLKFRWHKFHLMWHHHQLTTNWFCLETSHWTASETSGSKAWTPQTFWVVVILRRRRADSWREFQ